MSKYHYDDASDTYYTIAQGKLVVTRGSVHRGMLKSYTIRGMTGPEVCTYFNFPKATWDSYRRAHGWKHNSLSITPEEVLEEDSESLANRMLEAKIQEVRHTYETKLLRHQVEAAAKWDSFESSVLSHLGVYLRPLLEAQPEPEPEPEPVDTDYAVVMVPTDFHWGKAGWFSETGEAYSRQEAARRLDLATTKLLGRLPGDSPPGKIITACGSDWFHIDADTYCTTKGTPQDCDGSPAEIYATGCAAYMAWLTRLSAIAPVEVLSMPGNHDRHNTLTLSLMLQVWSQDNPKIQVHTDPANRVYIRYGQTLVGFHHGDTNKMSDMANLMAHERAKDWGETSHHIWFTGNYHHERVREDRGCTVYQLPSLAGKDRYHSRNGYVYSQPRMQAHIIDESEGVVAILSAGVKA